MVWRVEWAFREIVKRFSGQRDSIGVRMKRLQSTEPHSQRHVYEAGDPSSTFNRVATKSRQDVVLPGLLAGRSV